MFKNREKLISELRSAIQGDVLETDADRHRYSNDESIFEIVPTVIVAPQDERDVQAIVTIAQFFSLPITARGGGTSVCGQSIGEGIVIDFSQYMNEVREIGTESAVVGPGVIQHQLNQQLGKEGKRFVPDPGSRMHCTIGGMVATNASGPHCFAFGSTRDHVKRMRVVLSDGAILESSSLSRRFPTLHPMIGNAKTLIAECNPATRKNSSGYALSELAKDPPDYARFLTGSEGTLALTTEIEVKILPLPKTTTMAIFPFQSMRDALLRAEDLRELKPVAMELIDHHVIRAICHASPAFSSFVGLDEAEASLWVEWEDVRPRELGQWKCQVIEDPAARSNLWGLRSRASRLLHQQAGRKKPLRCVEDTVVPVDRLLEHVEGLREIFRRHDCDGAIFGHAGDGHVHVNPTIDITSAHLEERLDRLMDEVYDQVLSLGGSISGEHGDGLLRRTHARKQWAKLLPFFQLIKETFDPVGILNPDKKFSLVPIPRPSLRNLNEIGLEPQVRPSRDDEAAEPVRRG